jgi:hypothetical protein
MRLKYSSLSILQSTIAVCVVFLAMAASISAQSSLPTGAPKPDEKLELLEEEMRIKRSISHAQKEHQKNIDRAELLSSLSAELKATFKQKHHLETDDFKKLDKLEKLAKSIRSAAGGSDDAKEAEEIPSELPAVISSMAELAKALKVEVEKTPRQVISAAVIDQANVLLELIRLVRRLSART